MQIIARNTRTGRTVIWDNISLEQITAEKNYVYVLFRYPNYPTLAWEAIDLSENQVTFNII